MPDQQKYVIPEVIHIPSASDNSPKSSGIAVYKYSSSEESDHEECYEEGNYPSGYVRGILRTLLCYVYTIQKFQNFLNSIFFSIKD